VVADGMAGTRHDSNQELIGQGLANIVAPLFGGFAATDAIARTATNIRNGATSPLAGIVHSVFLVLLILLLSPLASAILLCCLSAVLFVVAWNMSELPHVLRLVRMADVVNVEQQIGRPAGDAGTEPEAAAGILIFSIEGPFFFGAAEKLERSLQPIQRAASTLILRMGNMPFVDATGIFARGNHRGFQAPRRPRTAG
jgi:SulP family sulfate permease